MPLDHYVTLGRSRLRVSPFALGATTFGEDRCSVARRAMLQFAGTTVDGGTSTVHPPPLQGAVRY